MATEQFTYITYLDYDSESGIATPSGDGEGSRDWIVLGGADDVLQPGETISLQDPTPGGETFTTTYVGYTPDGIIVQGGLYGDPVLLSNGPGPASMTVTEGPHVVCFLAGTMIATPYGEAAVETLQPGDLVLTASGGMAPVKWLLRQTVSTAFADPTRVAPIRIRAGALGEGAPRRDLLVSADHALLLDGFLAQAGALVNGSSVVRETAMAQRFTYFHVELHTHDLVLAEGVAAETFIDNVTRRAFDNWRDYEAVHGAEAPPAREMDLTRIKSARQLPPELAARLGLRRAA